MFNNQSGSRRWTHFHSALQLAVQRSAHKWTFDDFAECFPLYVEEDKNGASATFNSISDYIEAQDFRDLDKLFKDYNVQDNVDALHKIVTDAKDRKACGNIGNDTWKGDLDPRVAVCARIVPISTSEAERLRAKVAEMEAENRSLHAELQEIVEETDELTEFVFEVRSRHHAVYEKWMKTPLDDIEAWVVQTKDSLKPES